MSTISRSPGSAPSTAIGPLSTCTVDSGASRTSSAESSLWIAPSNHSRQCTRKVSSGRTVTWVGMSGCQRLCPRSSCSVNGLLESRGKTTSGMAGVLVSGGGGGGGGGPGFGGGGGGGGGGRAGRGGRGAGGGGGAGGAPAGCA